MRHQLDPVRANLLALAAAAGFALLPGAALAHDGEPHGTPLWADWSWDPLIVGGLVVMAVGYGVGARRMWHGARAGRAVLRRQSLCFAGAVVTLVAAVLSPLDALAHATFSAHMVQHLLLILVAAPLLVLARPLPALIWALRGTAGPPGWLMRASRLSLSALRSRIFAPAAWALHAAALWAWHTPQLYDAAVASPPVHAAEHLAFLGTALLFWWAALGPPGAGRLDPGAGVLYVFTMAAQGSVLAALLTFARTPWYASHGADLADQQLAGLLMWIPSGVVYVLAALWLLARWLGEAERRAAGRERLTEVRLR